MENKIKLAILWHMHQPPYSEPASKTYILPWVYLHAVKDYYDMAALVKSRPGLRISFNLTPCLIMQLITYTTGKALDKYLDIAKKEPEELTRVEKGILLDNFFNLNYDTMISPMNRFRNLYAIKKSCGSVDEAIDTFSNGDLRDLQTLYYLAWCGETLKKDPEIAALLKKGRGFTKEDKDLLFGKQLQIIKKIIPLYRELNDSGQIELSTSPFYHPILPLLYSSEIALEADPGATLPVERFSAPSEVDRQITLGRDYFSGVFACEPKGMWPPEGAVSSQITEMISGHGFKWIATDEAILARSLGKKRLSYDEKFSVYRHGELNIFFRDQFLSDQIGFVYSKWKPEKAVQSFIERMRFYARAGSAQRNSVVTIVLDGENAWEFYENGGYDFLAALYDAILNEPSVETTTFGACLNENPYIRRLEDLAAGSWIDANFRTWIGDPVKNRAWDCLASTYKIHRDVKKALGVKLAELECPHVRSCILRSEASDWFWWFGEGHYSPDKREFDFLFRQNLKVCYQDLDVVPPPYLDEPLAQEGFEKTYSQPTSYINPEITGRNDHYYKWIGAGRFDLTHGSIQRINPIIVEVSYGFNQANLFFKASGFQNFRNYLIEGFSVMIRFFSPARKDVLVEYCGGSCFISGFQGDGSKIPAEGAVAAAEDVFEASIPVDCLGIDRTSEKKVAVEFNLVIIKGAQEIETFPWEFNIEMLYSAKDFDSENWII
ncbi:MAG: hypothetical protein FJ088_06010 [Deltaproteobacteria bacterium]|nr:hypothetical protein [Deltaproteobacteria bacterium]